MRLFNKIIFSLFLSLFVLTPFFRVSAVDYTNTYSWGAYNYFSYSLSGTTLSVTSIGNNSKASIAYWSDTGTTGGTMIYTAVSLASGASLTIDISSFPAGSYHFLTRNDDFSYWAGSWTTFSDAVDFMAGNTSLQSQYHYYYLDLEESSAVYGCTDSGASNYDEDATDDDGSCVYAVYGCTDSGASNYDEDATDDDGSCEYMSYVPSSVVPFTGFFLDQIIGSHLSGSPLSSISHDSGGYFYDYHELHNSLPDFNSDRVSLFYVSPFDLYNDYLSNLITFTFNEPISFNDLADSSDFIYIGTRQNLYFDSGSSIPMLLLIKGNASAYYKVITPTASRSYEIDGQTRPAFIYKIPVADVLVSDGNSSKIESFSVIPATKFVESHISGKSVFYNSDYGLVPHLQLFTISPDDIDISPDSASFSTYFGGLEVLADNLSFNMIFSGGQNIATPDLTGVPQSPLVSAVISVLANGVASNSNTSVPVDLDFFYTNVDDYTYLKYIFSSTSDSSTFSGYLPISSGSLLRVVTPAIPFVSGLTYSGQVWLSHSSAPQSFETDSDVQTFSLTTSPLSSASYDIECGNYDLSCHLKKFVNYLFVPSQSSFDAFSPAKFRNRIPFSYIYDLPTLLTRLKNANASSLTLNVEIFGSEVTFFSKSMVEDWSFVSFGRSLLGAVMIFATIWGVIRIAYLSLSDDE